MPDITTRVIDTIEETARTDGWCSRSQIESLMTQRGVDRMEIQRALRRGVDEGRLERDGDDYRSI